MPREQVVESGTGTDHCWDETICIDPHQKKTLPQSLVQFQPLDKTLKATCVISAQVESPNKVFYVHQMVFSGVQHCTASLL